MASAFSHAVVALALGAAVKPKSAPRRIWVLGMACAVLPDLDPAGFAFFSPFDTSRYFLPWQPVQVSPINIRRFFDGAALAVMKSELIWIWLPSAAFALGSVILKRTRAKSEIEAYLG